MQLVWKRRKVNLGYMYSSEYMSCGVLMEYLITRGYYFPRKNGKAQTWFIFRNNVKGKPRWHVGVPTVKEAKAIAEADALANFTLEGWNL